jgi:4-amino-4-deoxy-L-arabinose transferase-like glycosyltransferase
MTATPPAPARPRWLSAVAIGCVAAAFYAIGIAVGSHADSDGVIYAQMAREMLSSGDIIDTRWLGVVQFEKPPLLIWSLAVSGACFGFGEAALRLPITVFAVAGLLGFYWLARSLALRRRAALTAVALLASSSLYLWLTRSLMTDVPMLCCALWAALLLRTGRPNAAGLAAGAAVLAKGPAALPLLAAGWIWNAWSRGGSWRALLGYTAALIAVAAPWYAAISLRHGAAFWSAHVGYHVLARASGAVVPGLTWAERGALLWNEQPLVPLAALGLLVALRARVSAPLDRFALLWCAACTPAIVFSATVLPQYFLPLVPALALLAARAVPPAWFERRLAPVVAAAAVIAGMVVVPAKLALWLDPDFGPDERALGESLRGSARTGDLIATLNIPAPALVFYSGGLPVTTYGDDPRFLGIMAAVLMVQRQVGHAGELRELSAAGFATSASHNFVVAGRVRDAERAVALLRRQLPARRLFRLVRGERMLINDAALGDPL